MLILQQWQVKACLKISEASWDLKYSKAKSIQWEIQHLNLFKENGTEFYNSWRLVFGIPGGWYHIVFGWFIHFIVNCLLLI